MPNEKKLKTAEVEKISHLDFFKIAISVDCVIFSYADKQLKVLVIKSDMKEFFGSYSLLGDLVRPDEDLDTASYRILKERTGMEDVYLEQVHTFGGINRHPSGRVITTAYYSLIDVTHQKLRLTDNGLQWHAVKEIAQMAFDHKIILDTCLNRLKEQIDERPVVFNLLPEKFSLRELQEVYEAILSVELDRRNFRKKMAAKDWLIDLNEMEKGASHRPGKLYKAKTQLLKRSTKQQSNNQKKALV